MLALPRAVERQGPIDIDRDAHDRILRYGLRELGDARARLEKVRAIRSASGRKARSIRC